MRKKNEDSLRDLGDILKCTNTSIIGLPKADERNDSRKYLKRY